MTKVLAFRPAASESSIQPAYSPAESHAVTNEDRTGRSVLVRFLNGTFDALGLVAGLVVGVIVIGICVALVTIAPEFFARDIEFEGEEPEIEPNAQCDICGPVLVTESGVCPLAGDRWRFHRIVREEAIDGMKKN